MEQILYDTTKIVSIETTKDENIKSNIDQWKILTISQTSGHKLNRHHDDCEKI